MSDRRELLEMLAFIASCALLWALLVLR